MLICNNKSFNKFLFFSFVFFTISFFSHAMISYASTDHLLDQTKTKQIQVRENISQIQNQQRQIIDHLEHMEKEYVK
jgi:hypothetical protein